MLFFYTGFYILFNIYYHNLTFCKYMRSYSYINIFPLHSITLILQYDNITNYNYNLKI